MGVETLVILLVAAGSMAVIGIGGLAFSAGVDHLTERFHNWRNKRMTTKK